ncbi:MAG: hypothetical protein JW863_19505, partial [Chitinispirillaceae bacterium]|nr:hypothetical protein [Chitinispirillaceae bacterium]
MAIGNHLQAQTIAINGKVTDQSGKGINRAVVQLKSKNLADTTDEEGAYSLSAEISSVNNMTILSGTDAISLRDGIVTVHCAKPHQVRVELFDIRGNLLENILEKSATTGDFRFDVVKHRLAVNMMVIRVSIGQRTASFRFLPFANGQSTASASTVASSDGKLAKQLAVDDELEVSAAGYVTKKIPITSYEGTVNVTLAMEDVGTCTASQKVNNSASGSGPHDVVIETNSDPGINKGTIYRPEDLGPGKNYPIFVWGEGACTQNGLSNSTAMAEIASHGYFVVADGIPNGTGGITMDRSKLEAMGAPLRAYIDWAIAENRKPCSAYYQSLDTTKISSNGFSCGGLMAQGTVMDPRITTWGVTSSGMKGADPSFYDMIQTPVLFVEGGPSDQAYDGAKEGYQSISKIDVPVMWFSK